MISSRLGRRARTSATTHNVSSFIAVPDSGPYWIYVGSGPERDDSVANFTRELGGPAIVMIDPKIGGYGHDITSPPVEKDLMALAQDARCLGVLGSIPCHTWSPARAAPGEGTLAHSAPLRDKDHLLGFEDANGNLPAAVRHANKMADVLAAMCGAVLSRGGDCWVETSPSRGIGSAFPLEGRERF